MGHLKRNIWLVDQDGHPYHVKVDSAGISYIIDRASQKKITWPTSEEFPVGKVYDLQELYLGRYMVTRHDVDVRA